MIAKLNSETEPHFGLTLTFDEGDSWIIGSDPGESDLVVDDPSIAPSHAIIHRTEEGFTLESLSDEFAITINHEPFESPYSLQEGDTVELGDISFRYSQEADLAPHSESEELPEQTREESEEIPEEPMLADIHFGVGEQGRWLLKVVGGPNSGAEFYMHSGRSYTLGTDPLSSDIIFQDTSVSRQHARISISEDDHIEIEDLKSRNGIFIKDHRIEGKELLPPSTTITVGTSTFIIYDREADMHTIISPLLPSIVKNLQQEQQKLQSPLDIPPPVEDETPAMSAVTEPAPSRTENLWLILGVALLIFAIGYGAYTLFVSSPVEVENQELPEEFIQRVLSGFPDVQHAFNPSTGALALFGHVLTPADKHELLYSLSSSKLIKSMDAQGLIIDEHVWKEFNSVLSNSNQWKGISMHASAPGVFVVTGLLHTRKEGEQLNDYLRVNFPYNELLNNHVVVEEDVLSRVNTLLTNQGLRGITSGFTNGELTFSGHLTNEQPPLLQKVIDQAKEIPGIRSVRNLASTAAPAEIGIINITDRYEISGHSQLGKDKYSVVIDGRILQEGDTLDGMMITKITNSSILLSKGDRLYRINYK